MSAKLWIAYETSRGDRRCFSLRGTGVSAAVYRAWLEDRCAAWSKHWPLQRSEAHQLINGEWCCIVDLYSEQLVDSRQHLLLLGLKEPAVANAAAQ